MSSSMWSSGVAVHAYRLPLPNAAIIKAIINGSFEAPISMTAAQDSIQKAGPVSKADAAEDINASDVDDDMSIDGIDELDDKSTSPSLKIARAGYLPSPVRDGQASPIDAGVAETDKSCRIRKVSTDTTSSNNSKFSVDSNSSKDTANTEDTEYSQSSIVNTKNKRSQIKTPEQCDESGSSRDINSSIQDESPTAYRCFPTFRLIRGTFPTAPSSPTPSDPASDSDVDDYSSVIHHSDDDYASDDDDDNESTTDPDSLDDLDIVHTIDRPEYGLQYEPEVVDATRLESSDDNNNDEKRESEPKVKAVATSRGLEMVTYYSDDESDTEEEEPRHPLAEYMEWKEEKDMGDNWEILAWYEHPDGNKNYVLGSDERWYWEYEGAFMLMLDEELEDFNFWRSSDPAAVLYLSGEFKEEEKNGCKSVCGLETILEENEEIEDEVDEVKEDKEVEDRNGSVMVWGLYVIKEEDEEKACEEIGEVEEVEDHQYQERVLGLETMEEVDEDEEDYKVFL
ncbi:hypothetical protein QR685DRAFT_594154 [Neurospora intermedia]|uniref:Uncharacterized protein n=1 Tax=Neurospora intermedia TaxID=5142 RepID=A0ABR3DTC2_NEUIN